LISLKIAKLRVKNQNLRYFEANFRFAQPFFVKLKWTNNCSICPGGLRQAGKIKSCKNISKKIKYFNLASAAYKAGHRELASFGFSAQMVEAGLRSVRELNRKSRSGAALLNSSVCSCGGSSSSTVACLRRLVSSTVLSCVNHLYLKSRLDHLTADSN
jgi:hypothetical protein